MGRRPFARKFVDSDPVLNHTGAMKYSEWDTKYHNDFQGAQVRSEDRARTFEAVDNILPSARYDAKEPEVAAAMMLARQRTQSARTHRRPAVPNGQIERPTAPSSVAIANAQPTPFDWREDWRTSYRSNFEDAPNDVGARGLALAPGLAAAVQAAAQPRGVRGGPNAAISGKGFLESTTSYQRDFLQRKAQRDDHVPASAHFGKATASTVPMPGGGGGGNGLFKTKLPGREGTSYHLHYEADGSPRGGDADGEGVVGTASGRKSGEKAPLGRSRAALLASHRPRTAASAREFRGPQQEQMRPAGKPLSKKGNASYDDWEKTNFPKAWRKALVRKGVTELDAAEIQGTMGLSEWDADAGTASIGGGDGPHDTTYQQQYGTPRDGRSPERARNPPRTPGVAPHIQRAAQTPRTVVPAILAGPRHERVFQAQTTYKSFHAKPTKASEAGNAHALGLDRAKAKTTAIAHREGRMTQAAEAAARAARASGAPLAEAKAAALVAARDAYEACDVDDETSTVVTNATGATRMTQASHAPSHALSCAASTDRRESLEARLTAIVAGA